MSEIVLKYDNKISIGLNETYVVANVADYDHYIFANAEPVDNFTPDILKKFLFPKSVAFVGPNLRISSVSSEKTVNLDFYAHNFKNMFLFINVNETETLWLNFISEKKLKRFKQIILTLNLTENQIGLNKLNNTHYMINMQNNNDKVTITYLRKDVIETSILKNNFIEEIVAVEGPIADDFEEKYDVKDNLNIEYIEVEHVDEVERVNEIEHVVESKVEVERVNEVEHVDEVEHVVESKVEVERVDEVEHVDEVERVDEVEHVVESKVEVERVDEVEHVVESKVEVERVDEVEYIDEAGINSDEDEFDADEDAIDEDDDNSVA